MEGISKAEAVAVELKQDFMTVSTSCVARALVSQHLVKLSPNRPWWYVTWVFICKCNCMWSMVHFHQTNSMRWMLWLGRPPGCCLSWATHSFQKSIVWQDFGFNRRLKLRLFILLKLAQFFLFFNNTTTKCIQFYHLFEDAVVLKSIKVAKKTAVQRNPTINVSGCELFMLVYHTLYCWGHSGECDKHSLLWTLIVIVHLLLLRWAA